MRMEGFNRPKQAPKLTLETATAAEPVHGLGIERLTTEETAELDAFLSSIGADRSDAYLHQLTEADVADMMEYARAKDPEDRKKLEAAIAEAIVRAQEADYRMAA